MMGKDREASKGGRDTNTIGKKAERGTENQNLQVGYRQGERKINAGSIIDISGRRRRRLSRRKKVGNCFFFCLWKNKKTAKKGAKDMETQWESQTDKTW